MIAGKARPYRVAAAVLAAGLLLAGCGGGGGTDDSLAPSSVGGPGDPSKATRTVEIRAGDDLRFQPNSISAKVGETITFKVINVASIEHDFTLGDEKAQDAHEKEMRAMESGADHNHGAMGDSSNAVHIPPGQTKEITWTFTKAGSIFYGCHQPGHYASGMKGTLTIA